MELPNGMGIFRVSTFEYLRETLPGDHNYPNIEVLRIKVKTNLSGKSSRVLAIPEKEPFGVLQQAMDEYIGEGNTEQEALEACLSRIMNIKFADIFPRKP